MQMIAEAVGQCGQVLEELVETHSRTEMNPDSFRAAVGTMKDDVNDLGRAAMATVIACAESRDDVVEREGDRYRFKQVTPKN